MRHCTAIVTLVLAAVMAAGAVASSSVPEPNIIPRSWELEFEHQPIQSIRLMLPGDGEARTYWYMLYTVTNRTGADLDFVPEFVMYADNGDIVPAGRKVSTAVFAAIQKRHNNPLLVAPASVTGRLLQGEDNAKDSVAIWRDIDADARGFDVFVKGLSGEKVKVTLPVAVKGRGPDGKETMVTEAILSKTLQLTYPLPGEAASRGQAEVKAIRSEWVMR